MATKEIDTANKFVVGNRADAIVIGRPLAVLSKGEALNLAAWLVAIADDRDEFPAILEAIKNT